MCVAYVLYIMCVVCVVCGKECQVKMMTFSVQDRFLLRRLKFIQPENLTHNDMQFWKKIFL